MEDLPIYVQKFLLYMSNIKNKSPNTVKQYEYDLRRLFRFLKCKSMNKKFDEDQNINISDIDIKFIESISWKHLFEFINYLNVICKNAPASRARKIACIKSFFNYLTNKEKVLENNPAIELETPKLDKKLPKYLTLDEATSLLHVIDGENKERDYAIVMLFLNCGLRLSELISIDIPHIKGDRLSVIGKGSKERTIYLNQVCIDSIANYLKVRPHDKILDREALFLSERKSRISRRTVEYIVKKYVQMAGLDTKKYSPHKLRHTAATLMYKYANVDIRALQEILGHESISTTEIYTHVDNEQIRRAIDDNPLNKL